MTSATITCPACGDTPASPDEDPDFLAKTISRCSACDAHIVYGELAPTFVVEPSSFDTPFGSKPAFVFRLQAPITKAVVHEFKVDPGQAFTIAQSIISMVRP